MKKGISLITLIITIVVIIILAAAVILSLTDNNPINSARVANLLNSKESLQDSILLYNSNIFLKEASGVNDNAQYSYFLGIDDSNYRLVELNDGVDSSKYEVSDIKSAVVSKNDAKIVIYKLDKTSCMEHEITLPKTLTNDSNWYVSGNGEVYLGFDRDLSIPDFIKKASLNNSALDKMIVVLGKEDSTNEDPYASIEESDKSMFLYEDNGDGTVSLTGFNSEYTEKIPDALKLPVSYDNKPITKISQRAITNVTEFSNVKILVVPEGIREIGLGAFGAATNIEELYLPSTLESIGVSVFTNSKTLKKVTLPNVIVSSSSQNYRVSDLFSASKTSIEEVKFSGKIISIGNSAFDGFTGLKSIIIPNYVESIGNKAFNGCTALTGKITIPSEVTQIGTQAFNKCNNISEIDLSKAAKLESIGDQAFANNDLVNKITIPEGVTIVGNGAFSYFKSLEEIYFPSTLQTIGANVCTGDATIKRITIPNVIVSNNTQGYNSNGQFSASKTSIEEVKFSGEITAIGNNAFDGFTGLKSVKFTDSIQSIGNYSFRNCTALTGEVVIPAEITQIGQYAFSNCKSISSINFTRASKLTTIGRNAFSGNESITEVVLPEGLIDIGIAAFSSDTNLTNATIPESVTTIGSNAFGSCNLLTQIKYKGSATGSPWGASKATIVTDF